MSRPPFTGGRLSLIFSLITLEVLLFTQGSIGHRMVYEAVIGYFSYGFSLKVLLFFSLSSLSFPSLASTFFRGPDESDRQS